MSMIGICDWGIGGLGVFKALRESGVTTDIVYFSDSGYTPYGKVSAKELKARWEEVRNFLMKQGADQIIVACNALSTVVTPEQGVITIASAVKKIIKDNTKNNVAIIGGNRTIESGIYDLGFGHKQRVAQPLSALVEIGKLEGDDVEKEVKKVMEPIQDVDIVILACTHYPVLIPVFRKLYPTVDFIDPVNELLKEISVSFSGNETTKCYTSGAVAQMRENAEKVWSVVLGEIRKSNQN